ncbi:MAG: hypothetical protein ACR2QV_10180 [Gammaproteobacteria bacterium]
METRTMRKGILLLVSVIGLLAAANAPAMSVTYKIGPHSIGNWSGSFIHRASQYGGKSDLDMNRDGRLDNLYTNGNSRRIGGSLTGDWDGTTLSNITGKLGHLTVTGGSLGGDYYADNDGRLMPLWSLDVANKGTFYFEDMPINQINKNMLTLWGQNGAAYRACHNCGKRLGLDLYGESVSLPEPRSLAIALLGMLAIPFVLRQRRATQRLPHRD